jgi:hypothetical protein
MSQRGTKKKEKEQAGVEPATTTSAEEEIHLGKRPQAYLR